LFVDAGMPSGGAGIEVAR